MATAKLLDEVTDCSICTEVCTDPRVLPCLHTYCLKCVEDLGKQNKPGDKLPCPLCRKEFIIPVGGLASLPKNFFVNKLLRVKEIDESSDGAAVACDLCSQEESSDAEVPVAVIYCTECQEQLCKTCAKVHGNLKLCQSHTTIVMGAKSAPGKLLITYPSPPCEEHSRDLLTFYCFDCKLVICTSCFIETHGSHRCSSINNLVDEFQTGITRDIDSVSAYVHKCNSFLENIYQEKADFVNQVTKAKSEINGRMDKLRRALESHRDKLFDELESASEERISKVEAAEEELKQHAKIMTGFINYANQLQEKGSAFDLANEAAGLYNKASELTRMKCHAAACLAHVDLSLKPTLLGTAGNLIGKLMVLKDNQATGAAAIPRASSVTKITFLASCLYGVTGYGANIFIIRHGINSIEVYDSTTFKLQRTLAVQIPDPRGLAFCPMLNCIYASSTSGDVHRVYRIETANENTVMKWNTDKNPRGISVNSAHNAVVACYGAKKIQEFTTLGLLVREIVFRGDLASPTHAVQITDDEYVVTHAGPTHGVAVLRVDGKVIREYETTQQNGTGRLSNPMGISVVQDGSMLIVDRGNNRILAMNSSLSHAHEVPITLSVPNGLQGPSSMSYVENIDRLYVAEHNGQRLLVFDNVYGQSMKFH